MLLRTVCILTLATISTLQFAGAQTTSAPDTPSPPNQETPKTDNVNDWEVDKLRAIVESQEAEQGAYGQAMAESLLGLGQALQQAGKHAEAIGTLNHSMHVARVNHGIYSIQQEPALRALINSYNAQQDPASASRAYTGLTRLYSSHYGHSAPELLPLLEEMAEWHRQTYIDNRKRDTLGYLTLSISINKTALAIAEQDPIKFASHMINLLRSSAHSSWQVNQHLRTFRNFNPSTKTEFNADTEAKQLNKATASNIYSNQEHILFNSYKIGRDAYQRIISILNDKEAPPRDKAEVMVELGNWFSIYNRPNSAKDSYQKAWHLLNDNGDQEGIEKLLGKPDNLPNFSIPQGHKGTLVEAKMTIDKGGRARNIEVLRTSPEGDDRAKRNAVRIIRETRFRPRYENGEPVDYDGFNHLLRLSEKSSGKRP